MAQNRTRWRRWLIAAAVVFVVYLIVGFLVLPLLVRGQIEAKAGAALKRTVTVEKVRMNPLVFSVTIDGMRVVDHDGGDLASWERAYVNFDPLTSLFRWQWHVGQVELIEPKQRVTIDTNGKLNIADLLVPVTDETPPSAESGAGAEGKATLPSVGLGRLFIENWALSFADDSHRQPFATVVGPMTFELTELTTQRDDESPYSLRGTTDTGETFGWSGTVSVEPPGSKGLIEFTGVSLPKHAPFAEDAHRAEVRAGTVSFATHYEVGMGEEPVIRLFDTTVMVDGLSLGSPGETEPAVEFERLEVVMPAADAIARTAAVQRVTVSGLNVRAERRSDGTIDLMDWLPPAAAEVAQEAPPPVDVPAPSVRVERIEMLDARVQVTDRTNPRPAVLLLDRISVVATNAGTDLDQEVGLEANMRWDEGGTIAVKGTMRPRPLAASIDVGLGGLELTPLEPFVEPHADLRIRDGVLTVTGHADIAQDPGGSLAVTWAGDMALDNLDTVDGQLGAPLLGWKSLSFNRTHATLEPLAFAAGEIAVVEPQASLTIAKDGTINLMAALRRDSPDLTAIKVEPVAEAESGAETTAENAPGSPAPQRTSEIVAGATNQPLPFQASVDLISISGGTIRVSDESVGGGFATELRDFGGTIKGLSSENVARADVDLSATLDGASPLRIAGSINPLAEDKYSDITVVFSNIDLPIFSAYSGQFIGQRIQKGKLRVDLGYKVSQNVLEGENRVIFDQFYLGEKVDSPNAMKLPIGLALALLRDRQGQINLDVPVRGNLDDPDFKYGPVVWKAIGNIILKAATSPFKMLGGILGGGAEDTDLSYIDFDSASAEPGDDASKKLDLLAKALFERPALRLEINAPPSPDGDRPGLIEHRLAKMVSAEKVKQLEAAAAMTTATAESATSAAGVETVAVAPEETEALLRAVFVRLFPDEAAIAGVAPPPAAGAASVDAGPAKADDGAPNIVTRFFRGLFGGGQTEADVAAAAVAEEEAASAGAQPPGETPPPPLTIAEIRERISTTITLSDADFQALSASRSHIIRERILVGGQVEPERVFLTESSDLPEGASTPGEGARVFFGLQ